MVHEFLTLALLAVHGHQVNTGIETADGNLAFDLGVPLDAENPFGGDFVCDLGRLFLVVYYQPSIEETDGQGARLDRGPPELAHIVFRVDLIQLLEGHLRLLELEHMHFLHGGAYCQHPLGVPVESVDAGTAIFLLPQDLVPGQID